MRLKLDENLSRHLKPILVSRFVESLVRPTDLRQLSGCVAVVEPQGVRVRQPK